MSIKFGDFASDELFTHRLRPQAPAATESPAGFIGTLKHWNADRWFGFIARDDMQGDIFVHGKAFELAGIEPAVGLRLTFTVELDRNGRVRADRVRADRVRRVAGEPR